MDLTSGLFALAGVVLGAVATEVRAWRELRTSRGDRMLELRRDLYAQATRHVETVASRVARWAEAEDKAAAAAAFWDALTAAYENLNEVRLIVTDLRTTETYQAILQVYRRQVERGEAVLPNPRDERDDLVHRFRRELGVE